MKQISTYINEAFNKKNIYIYKGAVKEFLDKYKANVEADKKRREKYELQKDKPRKLKYGPGISAHEPKPFSTVAFKQYPMSIIIDKLGYEKKLIAKHWWKKDDLEEDWTDYAKFLAEKINSKEVTLNELAQWWYDYDEELTRKNWKDPKWLLKQLNMDRFWNPYYPDDDSCLKSVLEDPIKILSYIRSEKTAYWDLSNDERKEVEDYYLDPANYEMLSKAVKKISKKIEELRPSYSSACEKRLSSIIEDNIVLKGDGFRDFNLKRALDRENEPRSMYSGTNDFSERASAVVSLVCQALDDHFHYKTDPKNLVDNGDWLYVYIEDLGQSKESKEYGSVSNSSFWTSYRHDFEVKLKYVNKYKSNPEDREKEIFSKVYKNITVLSTYYSGGWD